MKYDNGQRTKLKSIIGGNEHVQKDRKYSDTVCYGDGHRIF